MHGLADGIHHQPAGNFSGFASTHPVRDDIELHLVVDEKRVLVAFALLTDIG